MLRQGRRIASATNPELHERELLKLACLGGIDVLLHVQRPPTTLDLHDLLHPETGALYEAVGEVWTIGSPFARELAKVVADGGGEVMRAAAVTGEARSPLGARVLGQKWTPEQLER